MQLRNHNNYISFSLAVTVHCLDLVSRLEYINSKVICWLLPHMYTSVHRAVFIISIVYCNFHHGHSLLYVFTHFTLLPHLHIWVDGMWLRNTLHFINWQHNVSYAAGGQYWANRGDRLAVKRESWTSWAESTTWLTTSTCKFEKK